MTGKRFIAIGDYFLPVAKIVSVEVVKGGREWIAIVHLDGIRLDPSGNDGRGRMIPQRFEFHGEQALALRAWLTAESVNVVQSTDALARSLAVQDYARQSVHPSIANAGRRAAVASEPEPGR